MLKSRRRRTSIIIFVLGAILIGGIAALVSVATRPEVVRKMTAVATFDQGGNAQITETIDYHFPSKRHGIYRVLPDLSLNDATSVKVTADTYDDVTLIPENPGTRIRIGNPNHTISGNHRYVISYPLETLDLGKGRFGWNGVGTGWDVPVESTSLDLVAPWKWERASCDAGAGGSYGSCTVTQPEPGHLVIDHGGLAKNHGLTVYASRGAPLAATPSARAVTAPVTVVPWWQQPLAFFVLVAAGLLVAALAIASLLRRAGRDWVMAAAAGTGNAAAMAYQSAGTVGNAVRVDDSELESFATTEFAPPKDLTPWQGSVVAAEAVRTEAQTAWLLGTALDGYLDLDDRDAKNIVLTAKSHAPDATATLLGVGFAGRSEVKLGKYDPLFAAMWSSLPSVFRQWQQSSGLQDVAADHRVTRARVLGFLGFFGGGAATFGGAVAVNHVGMVGLVISGLGAIVLGAGIAAVVRGWELHVRTPAGSALWLRVESFRRFLANSEAHHVTEAAKRGVLREYTAWAVALGEVDHWAKMVTEANLPDNTAGLHTAMMAPMLARSFSSTATAPSSSGSGGGGVGGGGGGGGGGSW